MLSSLNTPIKRQGFTEWLKIHDLPIYCLQETHFKYYDTIWKWKNREGYIIVTQVIILKSRRGCINFKQTLEHRKLHVTKRTLHNDRTISPSRSHSDPKCGHTKKTELQNARSKNWREIDKFTIITGDVNTLLSVNDRSRKLAKTSNDWTIPSTNSTSPVAQTVKRLSTMQETWVQSLGQEDPLEKEMAIHSSSIAWKIPWTEESGRLQSMWSQRVGHDWATSLSLSLFWPIPKTIFRASLMAQ